MRCSQAEEEIRAEFSPRSLFAALALNGLVAAVEFAGGFWVGSLALITDAAHNAVDCAAIAAGIFAHFLSLRPPDQKRTFGYRRAEVLAALANGLGLVVVAAIIAREAWVGLEHPLAGSIKAVPMLAIACLGLICNGASSLYVYRSGRSNINARAVFLHLFSDALSSVAAVWAALVIMETGWRQADLAASAVICLIILASAASLIAEAVHILMEGAPAHLDLEQIRQALLELPGVSEVHDLHLWSLTAGSEALSGHLVLAPGGFPEAALKAGRRLLSERFGVCHITLQIEKEEPR